MENSKKKLKERLKICICFQPAHINILKNDEKVMFYTGIPKLSTFLNFCDFISPFVERKWRGESNLNKKKGLTFKLTKADKFLITLMKISLGLLNEDITDRFKVSRTLISQIFKTEKIQITKITFYCRCH